MPYAYSWLENCYTLSLHIFPGQGAWSNKEWNRWLSHGNKPMWIKIKSDYISRWSRGLTNLVSISYGQHKCNFTSTVLPSFWQRKPCSSTTCHPGRLVLLWCMNIAFLVSVWSRGVCLHTSDRLTGPDISMLLWGEYGWCVWVCFLIKGSISGCDWRSWTDELCTLVIRGAWH